MLQWTKLVNRTLILSPFAARFDQVCLESRVCTQSCIQLFFELSARNLLLAILASTTILARC